MSFLTSAWDFPQKLHIVMLVGRAIQDFKFEISDFISRASSGAQLRSHADGGLFRSRGFPCGIAPPGPPGRKLLRFLGGHEIVAVACRGPAHGFAGVFGEDVVKAILEPQDFLGLDADVAWPGPARRPSTWWIMMRALGRA
jgi:hypothetical protein